jgi:hypothetical protein
MLGICYITLDGDYTEEPVWEGEIGEIAFLSAYRYGRAVSHISA